MVHVCNVLSSSNNMIHYHTWLNWYITSQGLYLGQPQLIVVLSKLQRCDNKLTFITWCHWLVYRAITTTPLVTSRPSQTAMLFVCITHRSYEVDSCHKHVIMFPSCRNIFLYKWGWYQVWMTCNDVTGSGHRKDWQWSYYKKQ